MIKHMYMALAYGDTLNDKQENGNTRSNGMKAQK